ncbi:rhomboid family intramembrane serine protease [Maribacter sp. 2304DJ31-5]|uniref:rhomboid family intramembrane serine protease n=1 Tax=Maribacter sp. 2304DJ31-5 TaxID=3386273 RepID=UPI0039BC4159
MGRITETVKHLIIINVIIWIATITVGNNGVMTGLFGLHFPYNPLFRPWQIITHMFMHSEGIFLHLLANMFGLFMFGSPLERMWGRNKFLFFYFSAGLGAVLLPMVIDFYNFNSILNLLENSGYNRQGVIETLQNGDYLPNWIDSIGESKWSTLKNLFFQEGVGASGCVMGLLVAFGMTFPNTELMLIFLPIPIKAKYFIPLILAYETISGVFGGMTFFGANVAHFAHVGGALFGFLMMWYWKKNQFNQNRWD